MEPDFVPEKAKTPKVGRSWRGRILLWMLALASGSILALMWWWDTTPEPVDLISAATVSAQSRGERVVVGTHTADALINVTRRLLEKRGGYLSNDVLPPGVLMDNVPNWEFGVLSQCRDLARALRNGFSRSQTQSVEDKDLQEAEPLYSFTNDRWLFPSSESQYREAIKHVRRYRKRLQDDHEEDAQFFARADNLADYLGIVESRLGSLSQRLSASVGSRRVNTDLGNDGRAQRSTPVDKLTPVRTPWTEIDDVFYEARGSVYALSQFLRAIDQDFAKVLEDKNARVSLQQIIRELENAQRPIRSPVILNGSPFGFFANHSLVMANYISRANAATIDLRKLLERG